MDAKEKFIRKANEKFNNKFDYSKFEYKNAKTKSIIICPEHGEFLQNPDKHLHSVHACKLCERKYKKKRVFTYPVKYNPRSKTYDIVRSILPKEIIEQRFYNKFDKKYILDLTNYNGVGGNKVSVTCPEHGESLLYIPNIRLLKTPCFKCSEQLKNIAKIKPYEELIEKVNIRHNYKYTYPDENKTNYKNRKSIIKIMCPIHGEFLKKAQKHLAGQGCFRCRVDELIKSGKLAGYSDEYFETHPDKATESCILYYLKIDKFYKIGISTNFNSRLKALKSLSKKEVEVVLNKEYSLQEAYYIEQKILNEFQTNRVFRRWSTELFDIDISKQIINYF